MTPLLPVSIATIAGYFLGAIPFAYLIVRARKGIDIRTVGLRERRRHERRSNSRLSLLSC